MKFVKHGLVLFVLSLGMFVFVGCGADNDSEAQQLAKTAGDPGAPDPKSVREAGPLPTSPEEHYANQQKNNSLKNAKYPGPKQKQ